MSAGASFIVIDGGAGVVRPPQVQRAPLAPFPQPQTYDHVLPFAIPPLADPFYRGQFCGIRIVGAPWVQGCNAANTDIVMTCLLDRYPLWVQDAFLLKYCQAGYVDIQRSIGHALPYDPEDWHGVTLEQFIALSLKCQSMGLRCDQWLLGGDALYNCNQDVTYWAAVIDPIIDALLAAGVMDRCCIGWQLDQLFGATPGNQIIAVIAHICDRIPQHIEVWTHWVNEALAWWKTGGEIWVDRFYPNGINVHDRFSWWIVMQNYLTGGHHQGDCQMAHDDPKLYQDKMKDTLDAMRDGRFGQSNRGGVRKNFKLTQYEGTAQFQFDKKLTEDEGDLIARILICTTSGNGAWSLDGYGNGNRQPDGWQV